MDANLIGLIIMPLTYAFVGWMTNVVALKMTFYPLKFIGIPPFLGWQGIVPRKSIHLALKSAQTITNHIIKVDEFFHKIDPDQITKEMAPLLEKTVPEVFNDYSKQAGLQLNDMEIKSEIEFLVKQSKEVAHRVTTQLKEETSKIFSFKNFFVKNLTKDNSRLIVELFVRIGSKEFKFIEHCGFYFGGLLGLLQLGFWLIFPVWWTLPIQGIIVGYITNFLALQMIFRPLYEKQYGPVRYQGLFLKRQKEVSLEYSKAVSHEVLHPRKLLEEVLYRRIASEVVKSMVEYADQHGRQREVNTEKHIQAIDECLYPAAERLEKIMGRMMNIEKTMYERMQKMPPEEFEPLLRSAFKEDEYILILIGAVLGAIVGLGQAIYMLAVGG